ncbi:TonB family protein [Mucilaginibacter yixingensis]|nr:TonB family protein [Mucilaginibacter yixingensis]
MKSLSFCFSYPMQFIIALLCFSLKGEAQASYVERSANPTYKTIYIDTVNLRGIVLDHTGKPVPDVSVASLTYYSATSRNLLAKTDANGRFTLDGAKHNDTLIIFGTGRYATWFQNRGSRYVEITLPEIKPAAVSSEADPIVVQTNAINQRKKQKIKFEEITCFDCGPGPMIESQAEPIGGNERLKKRIKQQLVYPEQAVKNHIEGLVKVNFEIEKDGSVVNPRVVQGIGYGCEEEVICLIAQTKWQPAHGQGGIVCPESIVVQFILTDK